MRENLAQELRNQVINPPGRDERIGAFSQAVLDLGRIASGDRVFSAMEGRNLKTPSYEANLLLRAVQKQLMRSDPQYPLEYCEPQLWKQAIKNILERPDSAAELVNDLECRSTQSNVADRYKAFKFATEILAPWIHDVPRILDIGCSRNHGLKKMHLCLPFKPIESGVKQSDSYLSPILAERLGNMLINTPREYGMATGVDVVDINTPDNAAWARCCSFYPTELLDESAVNEYDFLDTMGTPTVTFKQADVLELSSREFEGHNVITVSTFFYQLSPTKRSLARLALQDIVAENGVIIYQDFVKRDRMGEDMVYEENWFDNYFPYRTLVEAPSRTGDRLYEVFRWSDGRCTGWVPGRDLDELIKTL